MSVRRIPPNTRSLTGSHTSIKTGKVVEFESSLELDFIFLLDVHPAVVWFESQPVQLEYRDSAGRLATYTPDFLVHYRGWGEIPEHWALYEIKFLEDLDSLWGDLKPKLTVGGEYAMGRGMPFEVQTQYEIRTPGLDNAKLLWDYCRRPRVSARQNEILFLLQKSSISSIGALANLIEDRFSSARSDYVVAFWQLIADRDIRCCLDEPLSNDTRIWI